MMDRLGLGMSFQHLSTRERGPWIDFRGNLERDRCAQVVFIFEEN